MHASNANTAPATPPTRQNSLLQRALASHANAATCAGVIEIAFFHPFDTAAKRLMANQGRLIQHSLRDTTAHLNRVLFRQHAHASLVTKVAYLYPGSLYAVVYKVLQRVYKFAGQPIVRDYVRVHYHDSLSARLGRSRASVLEDAFAGCLVGMGEVILLPLDRLKVLSQTNEAAMRAGLLPLLRQEGVRGMYAGTLVTMARNAPGSFCLFGGTALTKTYLFGLEDYRRATLFQNMCASSVGACLSIAISNPMDVIKTRIQRETRAAAGAAASTQRSATQVAASMLREEGVTSFFKGLTPKLIASAPKLIFAYTMTEFIYTTMQSRLHANK